MANQAFQQNESATTNPLKSPVPTQRSTPTGPAVGPLAANEKPKAGEYTSHPGTIPKYNSPGGKIDTLHAQETGEIRPMSEYTPQTYDTNPTTNNNPVYDPGGGGTGGGSSSSAPEVDTSANPYAEANAAAAATTKRITDSVDLSDQIGEANTAWQQATQGYGEKAEGILGQYKTDTESGIGDYEGNANAIIDQLKNITGEQLAAYAQSTGQTIGQATQQINDILAGMQEKLKPVEAGRVGRVDTVEEENLLNQIVGAQKQASQNAIDYNVERATNELQRAQEDAQAQFQAQRDQIAGQERTARDNQALYSEMRGDRGGIGQAQYDAIANTAATNQLTVNKEQTKLATDTARQIADLRAQGEFQKADELLKITQSYLSQLMQLKQWADETNVSIDEFNIGVEQWEQEYNAKIQQALGELGINAVQYETGLNLDRQQYLTGQGINAANTEAQQRLGVENSVQEQRQRLNDTLAQYGLTNAKYMTDAEVQRITGILAAYQQNVQNKASTELSAANVTGAFGEGTQTLAAREAEADRLATAAQQMISSGITPTDAQLKALGWSKEQYQGYKAAIEAAQAAAAAASSGGGSRKRTLTDMAADMLEDGIDPEVINATILQFESGGRQDEKDVEGAYGLVQNATTNLGYGTKYGSGQYQP